jgi:hypothetical protein
MLAQRLASYSGAVLAAVMEERSPGGEPVERAFSEIPDADTPGLTREQLITSFGSAPGIGQDVGLFDIAEMT